jgi:hypothetical protein
MAMPAAIPTGASSDQATTGAGEAAEAMSEDMPCCPTKSPIPDCDRDCLFMAMCVTQFLSTAVQGIGLVLPLGQVVLLLPGDDTKLAGLSQRPPPKPPKT